MKPEPFTKLTAFLKQLDAAKIHHTLASYRDGAIMVRVSVPGQRWEIEFLEDGSVEVERFVSTGDIGGEEVLHELLTQFADEESVQVV